MFNIRMFEDILHEQVRRKELSVHTMDGYLRCIRKLEKATGTRDGPSAVSLEESINKLCQGNKQLAKYITAVKKYERDVLNSSQPLLYGEPLKRLRKKQQTAIKGKNLSYTETTYNHKINALKDVKLKLALRLQKQSGLRISEISDLTKSDIFFDENYFTADNVQYLAWQQRYKAIANDAADAAALYYDKDSFSDGIKIFNKEEGNEAALDIIKAGLSWDNSLKGVQSIYLEDIHNYYIYYFDGDGTFSTYKEKTLIKSEKINYPFKFKEQLNDYENTITEPMVVVTIDAGKFQYRGILPDADMIRTSGYEYVGG